ncbi:MAG TPA: GNAT family N-acetyltransferase [Baekduia sp.]|uniref:GNAT family N-acetyltransferase n=1 Tax=Baekduia sp. TaxID=2600305 RepID=UPI002CC55ED9|nr:GNAT family N-acetyltransferase [Baekduia sp.]HMJ37523.1 GNAT family N-acetyltransferase [Baekduia sp.]
MPGDFGIDRVATARLVGRRPEEGDADAWVRWYTDPAVDEAAWPEHLRTADDARAQVEAAIRHWERWGFGRWTVLESGVPVGDAGLSHTTVEGRPEVELAWFFASEVWNRGYATEMAREAVRVAFEVLELDDVVAFTTPANGPSRAVMEKLGMEYEREIVHAGLPHVLYRLGR